MILDWECLELVNQFASIKLGDAYFHFFLPGPIVVIVKVVAFEFEIRFTFQYSLFAGGKNDALRLLRDGTPPIYIASRFEQRLKEIICDLSLLYQWFDNERIGLLEMIFK
jgi:hypothetical protein